MASLHFSESPLLSGKVKVLCGLRSTAWRLTASAASKEYRRWDRFPERAKRVVAWLLNYARRGDLVRALRQGHRLDRSHPGAGYPQVAPTRWGAKLPKLRLRSGASAGLASTNFMLRKLPWIGFVFVRGSRQNFCSGHKNGFHHNYGFYNATIFARAPRAGVLCRAFRISKQHARDKGSTRPL